MQLMAAETAKQRARALLDAMPDTAKWRDILYALELAADIEHGIRDAEAGRVREPERLTSSTFVLLVAKPPVNVAVALGRSSEIACAICSSTARSASRAASICGLF